MEDIILKELDNWIMGYTPGEYRDENHFKYYHDNLWKHIYGIRDELLSKNKLNKEQKVFLNNVFYSGIVYRIQNYNKKNKKYIKEINYGESWSYDIYGVSNVTNFHKDFLLIIGYIENGINIHNLLKFFYDEQELIIKYGRYLNEHEVVAPVMYKNIVDVKIVNNETLSIWKSLDSIPTHNYK